jgi:hypothetical protein
LGLISYLLAAIVSALYLTVILSVFYSLKHPVSWQGALTLVVGAVAASMVVAARRQRSELRLRWRRKCNRLCVACGYDLRVPCGHCPECGEPFDPERAGEL